ncbi:hypothetical protein FB567DRAFT_619955 [Paraphoma chrysanthemicola]|uniref:Uncharacterized protein n=1 Tax=Paraphoma chrysanthemicola TaxID=798071 RepID=A0A8K0RAI7_9PLEO|nr:hypothetical protein FB567DRAFT_619955 [Paraphoma chrysanthemicola]
MPAVQQLVWQREWSGDIGATMLWPAKDAIDIHSTLLDSSGIYLAYICAVVYVAGPPSLPAVLWAWRLKRTCGIIHKEVYVQELTAIIMSRQMRLTSIRINFNDRNNGAYTRAKAAIVNLDNALPTPNIYGTWQDVPTLMVRGHKKGNRPIGGAVVDHPNANDRLIGFAERLQHLFTTETGGKRRRVPGFSYNRRNEDLTSRRPSGRVGIYR